MIGLPPLQGVDDLSATSHISKGTLFLLSKHSDKYYLEYEIVKRGGQKRLISQPAKKLKGLQSWILNNILNYVEVSPSCKGFIKGSSIYENAASHAGANVVLNVDISDFFGSVTSKQVYNVFKMIGYNSLISTIFTNICTYKGALPQGSPTSPMLANLVAWKLDLRIQGFVGKRGIGYTRYADDLTFSGFNPAKLIEILPIVKKILLDEGFSLNAKKTRISGAGRSKKVTGLVLYENKVGVGKEKYRKVRAMVYQAAKLGQTVPEKDLLRINGWFAHLKNVDKVRYDRLLVYVNKLREEYPDMIVLPCMAQN